jgi:predicted nucleic acid-binding protein
MILVDTSVWIGLMRRRFTVTEDELEELAVCPPILQEVLQGLDNGREAAIFRRGFAGVLMMDDPLPAEAFREAAEIYRTGRSLGVTIRSSVDCLIAAIAIRNEAELWHDDRDFDHIVSFTRLRVRRHPRVH